MSLSQHPWILTLVGALLAGSALAQGPAAPVRHAAQRAAGTKAESQPTWAELKPQQQQSLAPLAATWPTLNQSHKRKWIALSANYPRMAPADQALLHSRMAEWAALSPQQRTQARLNFAETKVVPSTDKKAKWEAYQALPPEEKRRLAAGANAAKPPPPPTAAAVKPVPQQKLARVPRSKKGEAATARAPAATKVDRNTLLPQPQPQPQPQPTQPQLHPGASSLQAP